MIQSDPLSRPSPSRSTPPGPRSRGERLRDGPEHQSEPGAVQQQHQHLGHLQRHRLRRVELRQLQTSGADAEYYAFGNPQPTFDPTTNALTSLSVQVAGAAQDKRPPITTCSTRRPSASHRATASSRTSGGPTTSPTARTATTPVATTTGSSVTTSTTRTSDAARSTSARATTSSAPSTPTTPCSSAGTARRPTRPRSA